MHALVCAAILAVAPTGQPNQDGALPPSASEKSESASSAPAVRTPLRINLRALRDLVRDEPDLRLRVDQLAPRESKANGIAWLGTILGGAALSLAALTPVCGGDSSCIRSNLEISGILFGSGLVVVGVGALISPSGDEYRRLVQAWNSRHPDRAVEWGGKGPL